MKGRAAMQTSEVSENLGGLVLCQSKSNLTNPIPTQIQPFPSLMPPGIGYNAKWQSAKTSWLNPYIAGEQSWFLETPVSYLYDAGPCAREGRPTRAHRTLVVVRGAWVARCMDVLCQVLRRPN
jgi:hypothetical protein